MMHNEQKVTDSIYWIGANDFVTPRFDNLVPLPQGISYNTYFIDDEKTCVLDGIDNACRDIFMDNLSYLLKGRALDYIIINHMEPDHSGSLLALAEAHPKAKIVASQQAIKMFEQFFHVSFKDRTIISDEKMLLDLGVHKLRFIKAPMVHWPEVTFTYDETDKVLFSADAFGTFGAIHGSIFADAVDYFRFEKDGGSSHRHHLFASRACPSHGEGQGVCDRAREEVGVIYTGLYVGFHLLRFCLRSYRDGSYSSRDAPRRARCQKSEAHRSLRDPGERCVGGSIPQKPHGAGSTYDEYVPQSGDGSLPSRMYDDGHPEPQSGDLGEQQLGAQCIRQAHEGYRQHVEEV